MGGNTSQEIEDHLENLISPQESKITTQTTKFEWEFMNWKKTPQFCRFGQ